MSKKQTDTDRVDSYAESLQCRICGKWLRVINHAHLATHDITTEEYKERFGLEYVMSPANRTNISRISGGDDTFVPREREEMVEQLRTYTEKHGEISLNWLEENDPVLFRQITMTFGSFRVLAKEENLPVKMLIREWPREAVDEEIRRRIRENESLQPVDIHKECRGMQPAVDAYYGSWKAALEAHGVKYKDAVDRRRDWNEETIEAGLRECIKQNGSLSITNIRKYDYGLLQIISRRYGSLEAIAGKLDIPFERLHQQWNWEKARKQLLRRHKAGKPMNATAVMKDHSGLYVFALRKYQTWEKVLELLGLDPNGITLHRKHTRESLEQELRAIVEKHGVLSGPNLKDAAKSLHAAVSRKYGSLQAAAEEFGLPFEWCGGVQWGKEKVVGEIIKRHKLGESIQAGIVRKENIHLYAAARSYFGKWEEAIKAAGFDPSEGFERIRWTKELVEQELRAWSSEHGSLNVSRLRGTNSKLYYAILQRFGTIKQAAEEFQLPYQP